MAEQPIESPPVVKQKKQRGKKGRNPADITPEYIEEQRKLREAKKEAKRQELISQGIDPDEANIPKNLRFIKRPMLSVADSDGGPGLPLKIMTYNLLAQTLIRRKLFPTSGDVLKWVRRSKILLAELTHYNADIMCLQEVDHVHFLSFWSKEFEKLGYGYKFHRADNKNHGICIVFRKTLFNLIQTSFIDYDRETSGDVPPRTVTRNVGLMTALEFTDEVKQKYGTTKKGIIMGTTHLFWHPFGTYDRTRQTYVILKKCKEFQSTINTLYNKGETDKWFNFFCGDFNSQPFDSPYLSICSKPVVYDERCEKVIGCSTSYQYSKARGVVEGGEEDEDEDEDEEEEEGGNVEKFGTNQPKDPVPEEFVATPEQKEMVTKLQSLHNSLDMRAISLYSVGYKAVHGENSGLDNNRNEPFFSNWAHTWRGLLDYIFLVKSWDVSTDFTQIDSLGQFEAENGVKIQQLLRMPLPGEMGEEPSGQPREEQYPSDHLCMMAAVELRL